MSRLRTPTHVHVNAATHDGSVVLNIKTGQWFAMNATAQQLWQEFRKTKDFEEAVAVVAAKYPRDLAKTIRSDAQQLFADLSDRQLLVLESNPSSSIAKSEALSPTPATPILALDKVSRGKNRMSAHIALPFSLLLLRLPFQWTVRLISFAHGKWCRRDASVEETASIALSVEKAAKHYPGRAACLENSVSAVLAAALLRRKINWVLGVADDPYQFHAWVESGYVPVYCSLEEDFHKYRRVLVL